MEIKNATTVHRLWSTLDDAELLAVFQYDRDANDFCKQNVERQPEGCSLVWVSHYDGRMNVIRKAAPKAEGQS